MMSLSLVQDYSSEEDASIGGDHDDSSQEEGEEISQPKTQVIGTNFGSLQTSGLPSPDDLFLEVTGPPEFLRTTASDPMFTRAQDIRQSASDYSNRLYQMSHARQIPREAVLEAKAVIEDSQKQAEVISEDGTNVLKDAFPRPVVANTATSDTDKRNRSKIKDKERNKRMKGQSSHATWKSETEMHLRQQFD